MQSAPLSAGQFSQLSVLVFPGKQEPLQHSRCRDLSILRGDIFCHIPDIINDSLLRMHHGVVDLLGIISQLHGLPDLNMSAVRSHFTQDHFHQRGLTTAVRADKSHPVVLAEQIGKITDQHFIAIAFGYILDLYCGTAQSGCCGSQFHFAVHHGSLHIFQFLKTLQSGLLLRRAGSGAPLYPGKLIA